MALQPTRREYQAGSILCVRKQTNVSEFGRYFFGGIAGEKADLDRIGIIRSKFADFAPLGVFVITPIARKQVAVANEFKLDLWCNGRNAPGSQKRLVATRLSQIESDRATAAT